MSKLIKFRNELLVVFLLMLVSFANAQQPIDVERLNELQFTLSNNGSRTFPIQLEANDKLSVKCSVKGAINFMVLTPSGTVIFEAVSGRKSPISWDKKFTEPGLYQVVFEDVSWLKQNAIDAKINLSRKEFCYGSCSHQVTTILNYREDTVVTNGTFKASYANEKNYPVLVKKGDTVNLTLKPMSGVLPEFEINNDLGEVLHYQDISKTEFQKQLIALNNGQINLIFKPPGFIDKVKRFIPGVIQIELQKISPLRYSSLPAAEVPEEVTEPVGQFDTVAEVYLDTIVTLASIRDITKRSKAAINIRFENPEEVAFYGILYGTGTEFIHQVQQLNEIQVQNNSEIIEAYCKEKYNPRLPNQNQNVEIKFSQDIDDGDRVGAHFIKVEYFSSTSTINLTNKSQVLEQEIYIKIVGFRLIER